MVKRNQSKSNSRNFGVVVLAGVLALLCAMLATSIYDGSWTSLAFAILLGIVAMLSLAVAIYGRVEPLTQLAKAIFYFPKS